MSGFGSGMDWLFWALIAIGVVLLVLVVVRVAIGGLRPAGTRASAADAPAPTDLVATGSRARDLLDERYARGELTTDEYRERVQTLREES